MRKALLLAALALTAALSLAACGSGEDATVSDPAPVDVPMPTSVPAPEGAVRTRHLATVMDTGTPELCLGPVAESYPPQCGGPEVRNWDWERHGHGMFDRQGATRWGTFALTGRWDGTSFEVTETVPGPLYDAMAPEPADLPAPGREYSPQELDEIAEDLRELPGYQGGQVTDGRVQVDVVHDDGSLQAWADEQVGTGVVVVTSLLVPAG